MKIPKIKITVAVPVVVGLMLVLFLIGQSRGQDVFELLESIHPNLELAFIWMWILVFVTGVVYLIPRLFNAIKNLFQ